MNGPINSYTDNTDVNEFLSKIDKQITLNYTVSTPDVQQALSLTKDQLAGMSLEDCSYYAYQLNLYSLHLQREYNRMNTIRMWAEDKLNRMVAKEIDQYKNDYLKYDIKLKKIIQNDSAAQNFDTMILKSKCLLSELEYVSSRINGVAEVILDWKKTKERINAKISMS